MIVEQGIPPKPARNVEAKKCWHRREGIFQKVPVLSIVRPVATLGESKALIAAALLEVAPPLSAISETSAITETAARLLLS